MPATNHDPHTWREIAQTVYHGVRAEQRRKKGKSATRHEKRAEEIAEKAAAREAEKAREAAARRKKK
ncbi:hypothetical protein [Streptomyces pseudogriseolus]|uniref:hypothetical protein n=1 Tax=Streptomyces pseudogriseolus TaxID=36817 RepID=UPI003FA2C8C4|nr:hypothetical protein [Streptomyces werraensis]